MNLELQEPRLKIIDNGAKCRMLLQDLLQRCHALLAELKEFDLFVSKQKKNQHVDLGRFLRNVLSEERHHRKVSNLQLPLYSKA